MIGRFFHVPSSKRFNITPRFYDPDKEEREERERRIKEEMGIFEEKKDNGKPYRPNIKGQFRTAQSGGHSKTSEQARRKSNTRLIVLIMLLSLIFYLFFYSDFQF